MWGGRVFPILVFIFMVKDMKYMLRDVIGNLDHSELMKIRNDLKEGGIHLKNLIDIEIKKNEKESEKLCSVCQNKIHPEDINNYTLLIGPKSFRKKASFCGTDCMEYFIKKLKMIKEDKK